MRTLPSRLRPMKMLGSETEGVVRGIAPVVGSVGLLVAAYVGDRWLRHVLINVGIYGGAEGWQELGLAGSLLIRLVLLAGLVAVFVFLRSWPAPWAAWVVGGLGALLGIAPPLVFGLHISLLPDGLPGVFVTDVTEPVWFPPTAIFLQWTAIGLVAVALAAALAPHGTAGGLSAGPRRAIGAALLLMITYPIDDLFQSLAIDLASGFDAYPAYMIVGLSARLAVMAGFVVLLSSAIAAPRRTSGGALVAIGLVGFLVLPMVGLLGTPFPPPGEELFAAAVDPGTAGRWMAGAILVVGAFELSRAGRKPAPGIARGEALNPDVEPS
jgi:hypothetical protein